MLPLATITAFFAALALTPVARRAAIRFRVIDWPDGCKKTHAQPTPMLGGVAVVGATATGLVTAAVVSAITTDTQHGTTPKWLAISAASALIVGFGILHDSHPLRFRQRLAVQLIASLMLAMSGLVVIERVNLLGSDVQLGLLTLPFTAAWLMLAMNAMNLLDGADGVATVVGIVISATVGVMMTMQGEVFEATLAFALVGALAGFLRYNFPPSSIFLGEAGSTFIGLVIGILASHCHVKRSTTVALMPALALLAIPSLDISAAFVRRILTGRGIALPDQGHLHHALTRRGWGQRQVVVGIAALTLISSGAAVVGMSLNNVWYSAAGVAIVISLLLFKQAFWYNEFRLLASRTRTFVKTFTFRQAPGFTAGQADRGPYDASAEADSTSAHQGFSSNQAHITIGMAHSGECREIWNHLTDFADTHDLSRLRLDLNGSLMADGHDVLWERVTTERTLENWVTRYPVLAFGREFGQLTVGGSVRGANSAQLLTELGELLKEMQPRLEELLRSSSTKASRGDAQPRVLFINRSYWPDCEATGQLLTQLCEDLTSDFDVSVLVGQPNANPKDEPFTRSGVQHRNNVDIQRVRHLTFKKSTTIGRALNLISFFISACWQSIWVAHPQVVVTETDPFLLPILGAALKRIRGCRLVVYLQDVYPDIAIAVGQAKPGIVTGTVWWLLKRAYNNADQVIVLGEDMRRRLELRGIDPHRIVCIPNWVDTDEIYPIKEDNAFRHEHGLQDKFVVMHSGNMGLTQGLSNIVELAKRLQHRRDLVFVFLGDGAKRPEIERTIAEHGLKNIKILPYQPKERLALTLSAADLHLVSMHSRVSGLLVPSKIYGIMASGTATAAIVPRTSIVHRLVIDERIGFSIRPNDIARLQSLLLDCVNGEHDLEAMGLRARHVAESQFDFRHSRGKFADLLATGCVERYSAMSPQRVPSASSLVAN